MAKRNKLTRQALARRLTGFPECPFCDHDSAVYKQRPAFIAEDQIIQEYWCDNCGKQWHDVYDLGGVGYDGEVHRKPEMLMFSVEGRSSGSFCWTYHDIWLASDVRDAAKRALAYMRNSNHPLSRETTRIRFRVRELIPPVDPSEGGLCLVGDEYYGFKVTRNGKLASTQERVSIKGGFGSLQ